MTRVINLFSGIDLGVRPLGVVPMAALTQRSSYPGAAIVYRFSIASAPSNENAVAYAAPNFSTA
jgi:hypothetical protein